MINENNRPQLALPIASAVSRKFPVLRAAKKLKVKSAVLVSTGAIAASGANFSTLRLQKSTASGQAPANITGNAAVDTQAGVLAHGHLALDVVPEIVLEAGETLYLDHVLSGTLTLDAWLHLDVEVMAS